MRIRRVRRGQQGVCGIEHDTHDQLATRTREGGNMGRSGGGQVYRPKISVIDRPKGTCVVEREIHYAVEASAPYESRSASRPIDAKKVVRRSPASPIHRPVCSNLER